MKDANQVLKECVLRAISDDYENLDKILEDVTGWAAERGISSNPEKVLKGLEELISEGYAQAFSFSDSPSGKAKPAKYSVDSVDDLWFYVTPKGKQLAYELQEEWR